MALKNIISIIFKGKDEASKSIKKVDEELTGMQRNLKAFGEFMKGPLGITAVTVGAVAGIERMVSSYANTADQVAKFSDRINVSTEFLSEMNFAAERSGIVVSQMQIALQRATRRITEFRQTGAGPAGDVLKQLNIEWETADGRIKSIEEVLPALADHFANLDDETTAVRQAFQLFDSEGVSMLQMLKGGSAGIEQLRARARELGLTITSEAAAAAEEYNDAMRDLRGSLEGLRNTITPPLIKALTLMSNIITGAVTGRAGGVDEFERLVGLNKELGATVQQPSYQEFLKTFEAYQISEAPSPFPGLPGGPGRRPAGVAPPLTPEQIQAQLAARFGPTGLEAFRAREMAKVNAEIRKMGGNFRLTNEEAEKVNMTITRGAERVNLMGLEVQQTAGEWANMRFEAIATQGAIDLVGGSINAIGQQLISLGDISKIRFGDVFKGVLRGVVAELSQVIAKLIITENLLKSIGRGVGGGGGIGGLLGAGLGALIPGVGPLIGAAAGGLLGSQFRSGFSSTSYQSNFATYVPGRGVYTG